jgi:hypothetical protein
MPSSRRSPLLSSLLSSLVLVLLLPVATAAPLSEHSASSADALFLRQRPSYKDMPEIGSPGSFLLQSTFCEIRVLSSPLPTYLFLTRSPLPTSISNTLLSLTKAWKALYPPLDVVPTEVPQAWLDALRSAEAKGLIPGPDVNPVATVHPDNSCVPSSFLRFVECSVDKQVLFWTGGRTGVRPRSIRRSATTGWGAAANWISPRRPRG